MTVYCDENMLVIAPHHDDAEFGLGGWMVRALEQGAGRFRVVVLGHGSYVRSDGMCVYSEQRETESDAALRHLGVTDFSFARAFEENRALGCDYPGLVQLIASEIEAFEATEVFLPLPSFNQDHRVVHDACVTALRPGACRTVKNVWSYPYPGSVWGCELPTYGKAYIELTTEQADRKMQALKMHASQWVGREAVVSPDTCWWQMLAWGAEIGVKKAEVLYLMREVERLL